MEEKVYPSNLLAWAAFHTLKGSRQIGFGVGPIPFSEIAAYCDWAGITCPVQKSRLVRFIAAMDAEERKHFGKPESGS